MLLFLKSTVRETRRLAGFLLRFVSFFFLYFSFSPQLTHKPIIPFSRRHPHPSCLQVGNDTDALGTNHPTTRAKRSDQHLQPVATPTDRSGPSFPPL